MLKRAPALLVASGLILVAGYGWTEQAVPTVYDVMAKVIAPESQVLWDVSSRGVDDDGNPDASRLSDADWQQMIKAAERVKSVSLELADAPRFVVAGPGVKIQGEGEPGSTTAAQVQGFVDANPKEFANQMRALAAVSDEFIAASKARDAAKLFEVSGKLDAVCQQCHVQFWYPQQAAPQ